MEEQKHSSTSYVKDIKKRETIKQLTMLNEKLYINKKCYLYDYKKT